jgi:ketosteroid isomerase-like protein
VEPEVEVAEVNARYYRAFEAGDLDAMSELWERSTRAMCTHPGWTTLHGWQQIAASYFAMFQQPSGLQFVLTGQRVAINGDTAWLAVDENLLGLHAGVTVAAVNVFVRDGGGRWRMVCHHGSVVQATLR